MPVTRISFGAFTLNLETRQLLSGEREVHLTPKAFELLRALIVDRPKVLSKALISPTITPPTSPRPRRRNSSVHTRRSTAIRRTTSRP